MSHRCICGEEFETRDQLIQHAHLMAGVARVGNPQAPAFSCADHTPLWQIDYTRENLEYAGL